MLSMRLPYFGIFISFEMQEILEEFKTALNEWFDAKGTVDPAGQPEPGTRPTVTGPAIGGVSAVMVLEHVQSFAAMVEDARSRTNAKLISDTPESLKELCSWTEGQIGAEQ